MSDVIRYQSYPSRFSLPSFLIYTLALVGLLISGCDSDPESSGSTPSTLCDPTLPECFQEDADQDGVVNQYDDFPLNPRCSEMNNANCFECGQGCARVLLCALVPAL